MELTTRPESEILAEIAALQEIQKTCHYTAPKYQVASDMLDPLFAEMARRHPPVLREKIRNAQRRYGLRK